jgi:transposase
MLESENLQVASQKLDHLGLVAATCHDLGIADKVDALLTVHDDRRVSPGKAIVAMIINGLGFSSRRLYMTRQFFQDKPTHLLLGADISSEDLTDYTLGHALDEVAAFGSSELFAKVAFDIALEHDLLGACAHLDSTSISLTGEYDRMEEDGEPPTIHLTHGFSKDHRPDLKQAVLSMVVNGPSQLPIWMEPLSGNSSDKTSFHETIKKVRAFKSQIKLGQEFRWIADSALYTKEKLLGSNEYLWVTRVPETIGDARDLVATSSEKLTWIELPDGYRYSTQESNYGGVKQRWLLIHSQQAFERERITFEKKILKQQSELEKAAWHLGNQVYGCEADAVREVAKLTKKFNLFSIDCEITPTISYAKRGRPSKDDSGVSKGFEAKLSFSRNKREVDMELESKGRFILATNDLDEVGYPNEKLLSDYKEQQHVEGGFRFLKDPWFMVDSVFLKSPRRIEALMMVMTLCLFVYNYSQFRLRSKLQELDETLPNQLGKKVKNPTARWIYQLMDGVGIVLMHSGTPGEIVKEWTTNLTDLRKKIIWLFGETACRIYRLNPKIMIGV